MNRHDKAKHDRVARVLIVDDHPMMRQGLRDALEGQPDLEVAAEADDVRHALKHLGASEFDLIVLDLSFQSGDNGLELIKSLRARGDDTRILVFSMHDESLYAERTLRAGAQGFLSKGASTDEVLEAIRRVLKGELYLSRRMSNVILRRTLSAPASEPVVDPTVLSDRELQVVELIGRGLGSKEIADRLCLSVKTIETHRQNIKKRLQLDSGSQLIRYAVNWVEGECQGKKGD